MPKLLIKLPSRTRPKKFFDSVDNIQSMIGIEDYVICASLDLDDPEMNNTTVMQKLKEYDNLIVFWGLSRNKIDAINRSIPLNFEWSYLLVTADDMVFTKKNFGNDIIKAFEDNPDAGLFHFPDQVTKEKLITLPVMTREFYLHLGYVYNPEYVSVYCDSEQMEVAKKLNKYKFVPISIFEHHHFRWNLSEKDALLEKTDSPENYQRDRATYNRRKLLNFGL